MTDARIDIAERGGPHEFRYEDEASVEATPGLTPSQTAGPFFAYGLTPGPYGYAHRDIHEPAIVEEGARAITIQGRIFDGEGQSIHDAMVEIVQADSAGRYASEPRNDGFTGYARAGTGAGGPEAKGGDTHYRFRTVKPGPTVPGAAPFVTVILIMRGLLNHMITRIYFPEDDHGDDPILTQVPEERRATLVAKADGEDRYRFDIHMQGERETVFFDL